MLVGASPAVVPALVRGRFRLSDDQVTAAAVPGFLDTGEQVNIRPDAREPDGLEARLGALTQRSTAEARERVARAFVMAYEHGELGTRGRSPWTRASDVRACGSEGRAVVPDEDPDSAEWAPYSCDVRGCPRCHHHRTAGTRARLEAACAIAGARGSRLSFLTLTCGPRRHGEAPLEAFQRAMAAFKRMTRRSSWRTRVRGWFASYEVTVDDAGRYHPHVHIILQGSFWPVSVDAWRRWEEDAARRTHGAAAAALPPDARPRGETVQEAWAAALGHPAVGGLPSMRVRGRDVLLPVVDIRAVRASAVLEVVKYQVKPPCSNALTDAAMLAWGRALVALDGRRCYRSGGEWYGIQRDPEPPAPVRRVTVASVAELRALAAVEGPRRAWAGLALAALERAWSAAVAAPRGSSERLSAPARAP